MQKLTSPMRKAAFRAARHAALLVVAVVSSSLLLAACDLTGGGHDDSGPGSACTGFPQGADSVRSVMAQLARYQADIIANPRAGWQQAVYYLGTVEAYRATCDSLYLRQATGWAKALDWQPGTRKYPRHANNLAPSQVYLELYEIEREEHRLAPTRTLMERFPNDPVRGRALWDRVDALFMAGPVFAQLHGILEKRAGEQSPYAAQLDSMYWDAARYLQNEDEPLFYRDAEFFGTDVFWGRGNGWIIASIPRILEHDLPWADRVRYRRLLKRMAGALAELQRAEDGLWGSDLKDPYRFENPETSASALFTYAIAWGINEGVLPEETYGPVVRRAWAGLSRAVTPEGHMRWVEQPGSRPKPQRLRGGGRPYEYGSGTFLMAGSEMLRYTAQ